MRTIADPNVLQALVARLQALQPASPRRWGTLTAQEMLCHLGDAAALVLCIRPRARPLPARRRRLLKGLALWTAIRWPHGWRTSAMLDPKVDGTRPAAFDHDLARAVAGLEGIVAAKPETLEPVHGVFGSMSAADWHRWAYKHTDHHLRQFGL